MMKLISAVLAMALFSGSTLAADLPPRKEPMPIYPSYAPVPPLWTGFYIGANLGGGSSNNTWNNSTYWAPNFSSSHTGVLGGGQIGFSAQIAPVIAASLETDFQGTSIGSSGDWGNNTGARLNWFGTVRGRLGWLPMQNLLAFGTGGFAYGELQGKDGLLGFTNWNSVRTGWTVGGGFEWMLLPKWSAKVEYLYSDLGNSSNHNVNWGWAHNAQYRFSTVRAGVNWHFNVFVPPGAAKY